MHVEQVHKEHFHPSKEGQVICNMASLAGHISAFLFLLPVGIRRLSSTFTLLLHSPPPTIFHSRPWYFSDHPNPQLRLLHNADLYVLLLALPIAAFSHLFLFFSLHRFSFALCSALLALFFLLLLLHSTVSSIPDDMIFLLAALTFVAEYGLSEYSVEGISTRAHQLTSAVTMTCAVACGVLAVRKSAVAADVALAMALVLKGIWMLQKGVMLYAMPPRGCHVGTGEVEGLECELEEDRARGVAMVETMFAVHAVVVAVGCMAVYWAMARRETNRTTDFETMITRPIMSAELEMD